MKRILRAVIGPAIFLTLTVYFGYNAIHGSRGYIAQSVETKTIHKAKADLKVVLARRDRWEARVAALAPNAIEPDMLDGQARAVLNLANPDDLVVPLDHGNSISLRK
jgi:cell division protein FtsB